MRLAGLMLVEDHYCNDSQDNHRPEVDRDLPEHLSDEVELVYGGHVVFVNHVSIIEEEVGNHKD